MNSIYRILRMIKHSAKEVLGATYGTARRHGRGELFAWWLALRFVLTGSTGRFLIKSSSSSGPMYASITSGRRLRKKLAELPSRTSVDNK